ncbi:hypothetical protein [Rubinisphaera margarita]|uniref:hypothetical protein n=1 Tax=Rubinisphaera margarita TaxID=2909586 RepID=UPI001EE7B6FE|nr:hypothetical protein [Rubinisphaera margarita]MCG6156787.1 hypothetical protein [Rubinisphaera margarita]
MKLARSIRFSRSRRPIKIKLCSVQSGVDLIQQPSRLYYWETEAPPTRCGGCRWFFTYVLKCLNDDCTATYRCRRCQHEVIRRVRDDHNLY